MHCVSCWKINNYHHIKRVQRKMPSHITTDHWSWWVSQKKTLEVSPNLVNFASMSFTRSMKCTAWTRKMSQMHSLFSAIFLPISLIEQNIRQAVQSNAVYVSDMDFLQYINIIWFKCWIFLRFSMIWDANFKGKKSFILCQDMCNK